MIEGGIAIGVFGCFYLLYSRKSTMVTYRLKWFLSSILLLVGLWFLLDPDVWKETFLLGWGMAMPFVFLCVIWLFDFITMKAYKRRFILWLQWSDEIDTSFGAINDEVGILDMVFSLSSIAIILGLMAYGAVISSKMPL